MKQHSNYSLRNFFNGNSKLLNRNKIQFSNYNWSKLPWLTLGGDVTVDFLSNTHTHTHTHTFTCPSLPQRSPPKLYLCPPQVNGKSLSVCRVWTILLWTHTRRTKRAGGEGGRRGGGGVSWPHTNCVFLGSVGEWGVGGEETQTN